MVRNKPIKKKKKKPYVSIISNLISKETGRKKEILIELKKLNKEAYVGMRRHHYDFRNKYRQLLKTPVWRTARSLLLEFFTYKDILQCSRCNKVIDYRSATLHHKSYKDTELFTPDFVEFIHPNCHSKVHKKKPTFKR